MSLNPWLVVVVAFGYMAGLWAIARFGERRSQLAQRFTDSGIAYALSIAIYCTTWTYYGSVGKAATGGLSFLPIYLGPTLACFFAWPVLSRLAALKERHRVTSVADFLSARFHRSAALGALVAVLALLGSVPYIALQLKAVVGSFTLLIGEDADHHSAFQPAVVGPVVAVVLTLLTILFGVRRLDPTERHRGMVLALAVECVVKLVAFVAVGVFVTWGLFDGFGDIATRFAERVRVGDTTAPDLPAPASWLTTMALSASAVLLLPRQFHVTVVENASPRHVRTAQWFVPLYLLLINIFVLPIAWAGMAMGHPSTLADDFVLRLPLESGHPLLGLIVFVGGFSAAAGMVMICSIAASTMATNHLLLPLVDRVRTLAPLRRYLLQMRWLVVALAIATGYVFAVTVGESYMLVNIGLVSFAAVMQFAPALLAGLFWPRASRAGALLGISAGGLLWAYMLLLPAIARSGWMGDDFLTHGPLGITWLHPEAFLGVQGLDRITHAVLWTMLANIGGIVLGTALWPQRSDEAEAARDFLHDGSTPRVADLNLQPEVDLDEKRRALILLFSPYLGGAAAEGAAERCLADVGLAEARLGTWLDLADLRVTAMRALAGALGTAAAAHAIAESDLITADEQLEIDRVHHEIVRQIDAAPDALRERIAEHKARAEQMEEQRQFLSAAVAERTSELNAANQALASARDAAESANRTKSAFLANMSHEIRTPMTAILGFTEMLATEAQSAMNSEAREWVRTVHRNAEHLVALMNDVLDLSKLEAGKMPVERLPCDVAATLRECVQVMMPRAQEKGLEMVCRIDTRLPPLLVTDPQRLRQIATNLLSNAIKFTESGSVRLKASWSDEEEQPMLQLEVVDTGIGMSQDTVARLFRPFEQGDSSMSRRFGGTGLGLSICSRLAELLNGTIRCTSRLGVGSVFSVRLPAEPTSRAPTPQPPELPVDDLQSLDGLRVLVVDDGPDNRRLVMHILRRAGANVDAVDDGKQGLDAALSAAGCGRPFDVIVMDMQMPIMDGYAATRALRAAGYTRPIVALTAHALASERAPCIEAGCDDYMAKPVQKKLLISCIARHARGVASGIDDATV